MGTESPANLAKNAALAGVAGFVTSFGVFIAATPRNPGSAAILAAVGGAAYAAFRAVVGYAKAKLGTAPFAVDQ